MPPSSARSRRYETDVPIDVDVVCSQAYALSNAPDIGRDSSARRLRGLYIRPIEGDHLFVLPMGTVSHDSPQHPSSSLTRVPQVKQKILQQTATSMVTPSSRL